MLDWRILLAQHYCLGTEEKILQVLIQPNTNSHLPSQWQHSTPFCSLPLHSKLQLLKLFLSSVIQRLEDNYIVFKVFFSFFFSPLSLLLRSLTALNFSISSSHTCDSELKFLPNFHVRPSSPFKAMFPIHLKYTGTRMAMITLRFSLGASVLTQNPYLYLG